MRQVIDGKLYDTGPAEHICDASNECYATDFHHVSASLYRTKKGAYFLAGSGGPMSMFSTPAEGGGRGGGSGIIVLESEQARYYAEGAQLTPEEMEAAGFEIEEG